MSRKNNRYSTHRFLQERAARAAAVDSGAVSPVANNVSVRAKRRKRLTEVQLLLDSVPQRWRIIPRSRLRRQTRFYRCEPAVRRPRNANTARRTRNIARRNRLTLRQNNDPITFDINTIRNEILLREYDTRIDTETGMIYRNAAPGREPTRLFQFIPHFSYLCTCPPHTNHGYSN